MISDYPPEAEGSESGSLDREVEEARGRVFPAIARWFTTGRIYLLGLFALAVLAAVLIGNRGRDQRWDFVIYYAWGSELNRGIDPWRPPPLAQAGRPYVGQCNYTPPSVLLFGLLARLSIPAAFWLWEALEVLSLIVATALLTHEIVPRAGPPTIVAAVALTLIFPPVHATLHAGQNALLLLLLMAAAWVLSRRSHPAAAGLLLAVATLLKAYPAAVGGYFLFRGRFKVIAWASGFTIAGLLASGLERWWEFMVYGVPIFKQVLLRYRDQMVSLLANIYQFPLHFSHSTFAYNTAFNISLAASLVLIALAAWATFRAPDDAEADGLCFGMWLAVALLAAPMSYDHELPLLLPVYLFVGAALLRGRRVPVTATVFFCLAIALAIGPVIRLWLQDYQVYCLSALATFVSAFILARSWSRQRPESMGSRRQRAAANIGQPAGAIMRALGSAE